LFTNWLQSIFEFGLQKLCSFNRIFFPKFKIPSRSKKKYFEKKFFLEDLISIERINVQKISQIGDGRLVDFYKKNRS
jgi:hypothetical protein